MREPSFHTYEDELDDDDLAVREAFLEAQWEAQQEEAA